MTTEVRRFATAEALTSAVAQELVTGLAAVQTAGRTPGLVLTGGTIADRIHAAVPATGVRWEDVEFWWGDERYVGREDSDRNAAQARATMLDRLPVDPSRVHEMPASDGQYRDDVETAALAYGAELIAAVPAEGPWFDILMLGIGPDGHCASLFPGRAEVLDPSPVLAVRRSPKPPPTRISMGMETLQRAREVWFVASGSEKAEAVAGALNGKEVLDVPASGPRGIERTVWFLDDDAAWML